MTNVVPPVERSLEACLLLDFYGNLLTERIRRLMELHFGEDLSYGEIAEQTGTSRQAVHDGVSRGLSLLQDYEAKLGLAGRFGAQRTRVESALQAVRDGRRDQAEEELHRLLDEL